jgi:hypothetical protein
MRSAKPSSSARPSRRKPTTRMRVTFCAMGPSVFAKGRPDLRNRRIPLRERCTHLRDDRTNERYPCIDVVEAGIPLRERHTHHAHEWPHRREGGTHQAKGCTRRVEGVATHAHSYPHLRKDRSPSRNGYTLRADGCPPPRKRQGSRRERFASSQNGHAHRAHSCPHTRPEHIPLRDRCAQSLHEHALRARWRPGASDTLLNSLCAFAPWRSLPEGRPRSSSPPPDPGTSRPAWPPRRAASCARRSCEAAPRPGDRPDP